ncbi:hypothetical protein J4405_04125 [Candidatus Woesearchaeota archaeon]|nr:hypothetical protein [Candidatus Woesearchaeota archaeon]
MKLRYIIMLSLALLIASTIITLNNYNTTVKASRTSSLEIEKSDLKECCVYLENNKEKTCSILKEYSCELCTKKCS